MHMKAPEKIAALIAAGLDHWIEKAMKPRLFIKATSFSLLVATAGCSSIGPGTLSRDRMEYITTLSDSWKNQMLLNLVKTRYADAPVFLDVASLINQYSMESEVNLHAGWKMRPYSADQSVGVNGTFTDRPTITYIPLTGEKFARSFMRPIPPAAVVQLIESGYRADMIMRLCVQTINGIHNRRGNAPQAHDADPDFYLLITNFKKIQQAGRFAARLQEQAGKTTVLIALEPTDDVAMQAIIAETVALLGIAPGTQEIQVVYGSAATTNTEIALQTRSMLQILMDIASQIEVPEKDVDQKRVTPTYRGDPAQGELSRPLVHIQTSAENPPDAFVSVPYRGQWFWIDDRDYMSKSVFSFLMFMFSLTETGGTGNAPIVTISTN